MFADRSINSIHGWSPPFYNIPNKEYLNLIGWSIENELKSIMAGNLFTNAKFGKLQVY